MKRLLLMACAGFVLHAGAQDFKEELEKLKSRGLLKQADVIELKNEQQKKPDSLGKYFHQWVLKTHKPGVYALPHDNMPCLVPDTKDIAAIPNVWRNPSVPFISNIPNPGLKITPVVSKETNEAK